MTASKASARAPIRTPAVEQVLRRRLGDVLVERGILTKEELRDILRQQEQSTERRRLGECVVAAGLAVEHEIAEALAELLGLTRVDLDHCAIDPEAARVLPRAVSERSEVLILNRGNGPEVPWRIAAVDPTNVLALDDVRLHTGAHELDVVIATSTQLRRHVQRVWSLSGDSNLGPVLEEEPVDDRALARAVDDAPTVRAVDEFLSEAVRMGASDIHVEPERHQLRIRFRIDGRLRDIATFPRTQTATVVSRLKIVSGMDIAERRIPQDGRSRIRVDGETYDTRVSTLPALHGEKVVIRILARSGSIPPLAELGLAPQQYDDLTAALTAAQGLVLITGPTGSGKTSTLYAGLNELLDPQLNVVTLEDPIEVQLPGITQVQMNERTGMTFAAGLRSILRQDPDVILVGEVRDQETADLALRAALTGHLVLTTLHTNDAVSSITRLLDMGAEPYLVASSLRLVAAQRLLRKPCSTCAEPYQPDADELAPYGLTSDDLTSDDQFVRAVGCPACAGTGYRGRIGVFEVVTMNRALRGALLSSDGEEAVRRELHRDGRMTLRGQSVAAARRGDTTLAEVLRLAPTD